MKTIVVIGAGTMGSGIAHICAVHGYSVRLIDVQSQALERGLALVRDGLDRQTRKGLISETDRNAALERIQVHHAVEGSISNAEYIIEAAFERSKIKQALFQVIGAEADEGALLASNTSSISITSLASCTQHPDRVVGMHFFNPVPVMKLVEVVRGVQTSDDSIARTIALARALGKTPVTVNDSPGFVSNRVLMPMINEAAFCVMEGVAEPDGVDEIMKLGMAHPMGPLALADLIGLDVCVDILDVLHREIGDDKYRACLLLRRYVAAGRLGRKSGRGFYAYESSD